MMGLQLFARLAPGVLAAFRRERSALDYRIRISARSRRCGGGFREHLALSRTWPGAEAASPSFLFLYWRV
jgi:hypothetical protein